MNAYPHSCQEGVHVAEEILPCPAAPQMKNQQYVFLSCRVLVREDSGLAFSDHFSHVMMDEDSPTIIFISSTSFLLSGPSWQFSFPIPSTSKSQESQTPGICFLFILEIKRTFSLIPNRPFPNNSTWK